MGVILVDSKNAGRVRVSRPASPGTRLWWVRLRGALEDLAAPSRLGRGEQGSAAHRPVVLPALYDHTELSLRAVGRVVDRVQAAHP